MRDLIKKLLREAVGVPTGIYEISVAIYSELLDFVVNYVEEPIQSNYEETFYFDEDFTINELPINEVEMGFEFIETDKIDKVTLVGMSFTGKMKYEKRKLVSYTDEGSVKMNIVIAIPTNTTHEELIDFIKTNKAEITSSISHELMHAYKGYKSKYDSVKSMGEYRISQGFNLGIPALDEFFYHLYFIHQIENVVRPTETYSSAMEKNISQKDFYEFLMDDRVFKTLKNVRDFTYEKFRQQLKSEIDKIDELFIENGIDTNIPDEEKIDKLLKILYINMANNKVQEYIKVMIQNPFEELFGFEDEDKQIFLDELINDASKFDKKENNFYIYEINKMNKIADKMIKKISKVYSIIKQDTNESIINWDLYRKLFVKETKLDKELKYQRKKK